MLGLGSCVVNEGTLANINYTRQPSHGHVHVWRQLWVPTLCPAKCRKDVGCCKSGDDEANVNVIVEADNLPSWLNDVKSMGPVEGLEFLRQKFQKRISAQSSKRAFFKKSEVHGGRVNDAYRNDIVQIAILAPAREDDDEYKFFTFSKNGFSDTLPPNKTAHRILTLRTHFHVLQLLNKSLDLMVAFQTGQIEMEGHVASKCLKIKDVCPPLKYLSKLYKIECWRWTLLSGMKLTYVDRHGNFTSQSGRGWEARLTEENSFVLMMTKSFNLSGSAGGQARQVSLVLTT